MGLAVSFPKLDRPAPSPGRYVPFDKVPTMIKSISIVLLTFILPRISLGQADSLLGIDCNPKLNIQEIHFFKTLFGGNSFNFQNKNIGFSTNDGFKVWGFENSFMPITKKEYFTLYRLDAKQNLKSKLIILDSFQKQNINGFDAIILTFDKKYEKKAEESNFRRIITVFGYRELNYPDNLNRVGFDKTSVLSPEEASFLNQIFKRSKEEFDFSEKKIAIIRTQTKSIIPKKEFIDKVKKHFESDFLYPYDFLYILNSKEKKETGGYDAVIIYDCKKCGGREAVEILKKNGT